MCLFPSKLGYPCGKCIDCLSKKRNDWSIRLQHEYNYWFNRGCLTYMALLTYDEEHLPHTQSGYPTLNQRDVQLFMKRLRKSLAKEKVFIRFFYNGEYGPRTQRPHYHILLFGFPQEWKRSKVMDFVQISWPNGFVGRGFGKVRGLGGIHYCTKYMINKALKLQSHEQVKPFNRMSKGLGMSYLFDVYQDERGLHKGEMLQNVIKDRKPLEGIDLEHLVRYVRELDNDVQALEIAEFIKSRYLDNVWSNGTKFRLPRYYRTRLFNGAERFLMNYADYLLHWKPQELEYQEKYGDYDKTHEVPMKILMAMDKTQRLLSKYVKDSAD